MTSPELDERWQCDLVDYKVKSPEKNDGSRLVLVCFDTLKRFAPVELLNTKEAAEDAEAFQRVLRDARGKQSIRSKSRASGSPKEVSTDTGAELKGEFSDMRCTGYPSASRSW